MNRKDQFNITESSINNQGAFEKYSLVIGKFSYNATDFIDEILAVKIKARMGCTETFIEKN